MATRDPALGTVPDSGIFFARLVQRLHRQLAARQAITAVNTELVDLGAVQAQRTMTAAGSTPEFRCHGGRAIFRGSKRKLRRASLSAPQRNDQRLWGQNQLWRCGVNPECGHRVSTARSSASRRPKHKMRRKKNVHAGGNIAVHVDVGVLRGRTSWSAPCQFKSRKRCAMFYKNTPCFMHEFHHGDHEARKLIG